MLLCDLGFSADFMEMMDCLFRDWQRRRVIFSSEVVGFSKLHEEVMIDSIKMAEIESVIEIESENESSDRFSAFFDFSKRDIETKERALSSADKLNLFCNSIRIETSVEGGNSGRTYYLQCDSKESVHETVRALKFLVKHARLQSVRVTCIPLSRKWVRDCLHSNIFKTLSALVIIAVKFPLNQVPVSRFSPNPTGGRTSSPSSPNPRAGPPTTAPSTS
jgi:hypothetical protein